MFIVFLRHDLPSSGKENGWVGEGPGERYYVNDLSTNSFST